MNRSQLDALARQYLAARFDHAEDWLSAPALPRSSTDRDGASSVLEDQAEAAQLALRTGRYGSALDKARSMLPEGDADTLAKLARRLLEADIEACKAEIAALEGEPLVFPSLTSVTASAAPQEARRETPRLSEVIEQFATEHESRGDWSARTSIRERTSLRLMCDLLGDPCIGDVKRADMRQFALDLARVPSNMTKRFPGLGVREVLERVGDNAEHPQSPKTINMRIILLRTLFAWAVKQEWIAVNPTDVLELHAQARGREQRYPLTDADVSAFMAELAKPMRGSPHNEQPWVYWLPRILALSGLRLNEAAQLEKCNVCVVDGVPVFDVHTEDENKTVKTDASVRCAPVHPRLVELGLLDFITAQPDGYLWPAEIRTPSKPNRSPTDRLSKLLMYRLRKAGVKDKRKANHSLRHTLSAKLNAAGVSAMHIADILGHEIPGQEGRYGNVTPLPVLLTDLSKVALPI